MGVRESWNELGTGGKVLIGLVVGGTVLVVGLVLLIILAAVLGSFVLGMGDQAAATTPQVSFDGDYDTSGETMEITHTGGESIAATDLHIETDDQVLEWEDEDGTVGAGDSAVVDVSPGTTVRVVWNGEGESAVLFSQTAQ